MSYESLKSAVTAVITANGNNEITGDILKALINDNIIPQLGAGEFKGFATTATNPGTPESEVFYIATDVGTYTNFGSLVVGKSGLNILKWVTNAWVNDYIPLTEEIEKGLFSIGINLLNADTVVENEYISSGNGNPVSGANWWRSDWIEVEPTTQYRATPHVRDLAYYDADKNYISGQSSQIDDLTTPANTKYIRFSHYNRPFNDVIFHEGATKLPFETYKRIYKYLEVSGLTEINESIKSFFKYSGVGANFNKVGVSFNAIRLAGANRGAIADDKKWKYAQVFVKNAKEDTAILAKSPLITLDKEASTLGEMVFPLMDSNLQNYISLDDSSFSGSTYFVYHRFFNENLGI